MKVMIVDDSQFIHMAVKSALVPAGYEICGTFNNGAEAVEAYANLKPDLLIMDVTMPVMDGITAARKILSDFPDAKIMMLTAMGREDLVLEAKEIGVKAYKTKPFKANELIAVVDGIFLPCKN